MPYKVKGHCVYKKSTGKKVGCTKGPVKKYLAALHANVKENNMDYKSTFLKSLHEADELPHVTGVEQTPSDQDAWRRNNPDIADDIEGLGKPFEVDGLDKDQVEKYSEVIEKWGNGINQAIQQMAEMLKYATSEKLNAAPGSEQFSNIIKSVPNLKANLSAFKSNVDDLRETVKLAINDINKERAEKTNI